MTPRDDSSAAKPRRLVAIEAAVPGWEGGHAYSTEFTDAYFSGADGLAEAHHVFLDGNQLTARWLTLAPAAIFTIVETGFGTGLNFLAAAKLWFNKAPASATLHFVATERHPLSPQDLRRALAAWPTLSGLAAQLIDQYPALVPGFHRLDLVDADNNKRIALTLIFGNTEHALEELSACDNPAFKHRQRFTIDAWFLHGFAPAKNSARWSDTLFQGIASLSQQQTTFSTDTVTDMVLQGLQAAGFSATRMVGYNGKKDMLFGQFRSVNNKTTDDLLALDTIDAIHTTGAGAGLPHAAAHRSRTETTRSHTSTRNARFAPPWHIPSLTALPGTVSTVTPTTTRFNTPTKNAAAPGERVAPGEMPTIRYRSTLRDKPADRRAAIIGGGIAGCSTALALARRGWQVTIYEQAGRVASGASGNPQGVIYPRLSPEASFLSRFNLAALLYAARFYSPFWDDPNPSRTSARAPDKNPVDLAQGSAGARCGIIVLPEKPSDAEVFATIANNFRGGLQRFTNRRNAHCTGPFVSLLNRAEIGEVCGLQLAATSALYFPSLGWIAPQRVCEQLVNHTNISIKEKRVNGLTWDSSCQQWSLNTGDQLPDTSAVVVIAASNGSQSFTQTRHLPLKAIRGQISSVPVTPPSQHLRTVICGAGYLAPASGGSHTLGATYNLDTTTPDIRDVDHRRNLDQLLLTDPALPNFLDNPSPAILDGRASLRCTTPDYLPLIGPAANFTAFTEDFALLRTNARADIPRCGSYWPGLYVHCGLGSRGFTYAPLGAELLAGVINREVPALPLDLQIALHPARFIIRDLKRNRIQVSS